MLGVQGFEVHQHDQGWLPVYTDNSKSLGVMSIGFLLSNQVIYLCFTLKLKENKPLTIIVKKTFKQIHVKINIKNVRQTNFVGLG